MSVVKPKIVKVKQTAPFAIIPEDIKSDITKRIGAKWKRGTRQQLIGLDEVEQLTILPHVLGVKPTSDRWDEEKRRYFANLSIQVDYEGGKEFNVATEKRRMEVNGKWEEIDFPVNPTDYIMWKQCLVDNSVANSEEQIGEGTFSFYLIDEVTEQRKRAAKRKTKEAIETVYLKLVAQDDKDEYKNAKKIEYILWTDGSNPIGWTPDMRHMAIEDIKDRSIAQAEDEGRTPDETDLVKMVNDPHLTSKAFVYKLLQNGILELQGDVIVDKETGNVLGRTYLEAAVFLEDANNTQLRQKYVNKLDFLLR